MISLKIWCLVIIQQFSIGSFIIFLSDCRILTMHQSINSSESSLNSTVVSVPIFLLVIPLYQLLMLLIIYVLVIFYSTFGPLLTILAVFRSSHLRTHSNFFLVNLAISDLLLTLLSCPITLVQLVSPHWPLPFIPPLCCVANFLPLFVTFSSTFSVCMIALNRQHSIFYPLSPPSVYTLSTSLALVWFAAFIVSSPMIPYSHLLVEEMDERAQQLTGVSERAYCIEQWPLERGR